MKKHFVLDENVIICAQKGENIQGERDITCLDLLQHIVANCHSLVLTEAIWQKYSSQTKRLERQNVPLIPRVMAIIRDILVNAEKDTRFVTTHELLEIDGLEEIGASTWETVSSCVRQRRCQDRSLLRPMNRSPAASALTV